ncbi:MAG: HEPN domain-containing protein [Ignisphaera sp.]|uniref:HEPN domain-containing protein n=1 Tax=Ignisphaera aggregans TaxID=334771 RepID=A0A7C4NKX6_9CREN
MSFEEAEVLRERAYMFLENSKSLLERGFFDLAAFNLEQYCQLLLKYKLLVKTGTYPRLHSLTKLIDILSKLEPSVRVLLEREDYLIMVTKLEDAYIGARYLPRRYTEIEVRALYRFVVEVFQKVVEGV